MSEFIRINAPRVMKLQDMLATVLKSAKSNKADGQEIERLLIPLFADIGTAGFIVTTGEMPTVTPAAQPRPSILRTPHILQIGEFVAGLQSEQLPSFLTHIVDRMCEEFETKGKTDV